MMVATEYNDEMNPQLLAFTGIAALLTITPGADMALVAKVTLSQGKKAAFYTALGASSGVMVHAAASALGLSLILVRSAFAFNIVKWLGAAYLCFLGAQAIVTAFRSEKHLGETCESGERMEKPNNSLNCYFQGVFTNVLNPKCALFYLAMLPQFISPKGPVLSQSVLLASIHSGMGILWLCFFASAIERFRSFLSQRKVRQTLDSITGGVLIALGFRLALARAK